MPLRGTELPENKFISATWVVLQFFWLLREALHEVELDSTFRNGLQQLATASPLKQLFLQFYGSFNKGACSRFSFLAPRSSGYENKLILSDVKHNLGNL